MPWQEEARFHPPTTLSLPQAHGTKQADVNIKKKILKGNTCFHGGGSNWWRFEFCPGRRVTQYHVYPDGSRDTILLGEMGNGGKEATPGQGLAHTVPSSCPRPPSPA